MEDTLPMGEEQKSGTEREAAEAGQQTVGRELVGSGVQQEVVPWGRGDGVCVGADGVFGARQTGRRSGPKVVSALNMNDTRKGVREEETERHARKRTEGQSRQANASEEKPVETGQRPVVMLMEQEKDPSRLVGLA
jgi:hypothetical protein